MDDVARLPDGDRRELFRGSATKRGHNPGLIEKDFWVCWVLKRLFTLQNPPAELIFRGGASLSKVWGLIDRFSDDVSLSFDRADLGFAGPADPAQIKETRHRMRQLATLQHVCVEMIRSVYLPLLQQEFAASLETEEGWSLQRDLYNPQTILFTYPGTEPAADPLDAAHLRPVIRLELGARGEPWPSEVAQIRPTAAEDFPDIFREPAAEIRVVSARRTFWEKATILHSWYHAGPEHPLRERQSRHYYDMFMLARSAVRDAALGDFDLLREVAQHKRRLFPAAWAHYDDAIPRRLRLAPSPDKLHDLERDYASIREMIFGEVPPLEEIIRSLQELEEGIHG